MIKAKNINTSGAKLKDIIKVDAIQRIQDSLADLFCIGLCIKDPDGTDVTRESNPEYIDAKVSGGGVDWDRTIDIYNGDTKRAMICIVKGPSCRDENFEKVSAFIRETLDAAVTAGLGTLALSQEIVYRRELERKLEQRNEHDMLTNLYNRYFFEKKLTELVIEDTCPVSVAAIDANLLKLSNDIFGHAEGDCLLQLISGALVEEKKEKYYCCRCGGDEFYVIMEDTGYEEADNYMKRVVERTKNDYCTRIPPSFAYGVATRETRDENLQDVIKQAEDEMYLQKIDMKCDGRILGTLRQCLMETGHFNFNDAIACCNRAFAFAEYCGLANNDKVIVRRLLELYPLGMLIVPTDVLRVAKSHVADFLADKYDYVGTEHRIAMMFEETAPVAHLVMEWNEHYDGTGKPAGLAGEQIALPVRLVRIALQYSKYVSRAPFGYALSKEEALEKLRAESGKTFDPYLMDKFFAFMETYTTNYETNALSEWENEND